MDAVKIDSLIKGIKQCYFDEIKTNILFDIATLIPKEGINSLQIYTKYLSAITEETEKRKIEEAKHKIEVDEMVYSKREINDETEITKYLKENPLNKDDIVKYFINKRYLLFKELQQEIDSELKNNFHIDSKDNKKAIEELIIELNENIDICNNNKELVNAEYKYKIVLEHVMPLVSQLKESHQDALT